jgi:tetratricopeptide (TPR) repeat protein
LKQSRLVILALASGLIIISVLLYFANRVPPAKKETEIAVNNSPSTSLASFVNNAVMALKGQNKTNWNLLTNKISGATGQQKKSLLDSAVVFWDNLNRPDISAEFAKSGAEVSNLAKDWIYAGQRFYYSVRFVKDPAEHPVLYSNAIECLEKGLKLDPANIDAKIDLAACFVEGSPDPMKGIGLLREIEQIDSNNVKLQMNFAMFSARSGQWDRAIKRYKKVLELQPDFIEGWLNLADAYEQNGQIEECVKALEKFTKLTDDPMAKTTINEYIIKLKRQLKK